jgi:hypothetical protein
MFSSPCYCGNFSASAVRLGSLIKTFQAQSLKCVIMSQKVSLEIRHYGIHTHPSTDYGLL